MIGFSSASHLSKINNAEHLTQPPRRKVALDLTPLERSAAATRKALNFQTTKNAKQHNQRERKKVALELTPLERSVAATRKVLNFQTTKNAEHLNQRERKKVALKVVMERWRCFCREKLQ